MHEEEGEVASLKKGGRRSATHTSDDERQAAGQVTMFAWATEKKGQASEGKCVQSLVDAR